MISIDNKKQEAIKELEEWVNNPLSKEDYTIYGVDKIKDKLLESRIPKSILNGYESLSNWYLNNYVYESLTQERSNLRGITAMSGYEVLVIADKLASLYPSSPPILSFDKSTFWLANCLIQKWYIKGEELIGIINRSLFSEVLDGGWEEKKASWFIIMLGNKGFDIDIDFSKLNIPLDLGFYKVALDNWNTNDLEFLDTIISTLCDYHLENAHYGKQETTSDIQFGDSAWFVFVFEILAFLSLREKKGLKNPVAFSHPLMKLELNKLPYDISEIKGSDLFLITLKKMSI